MTLDSFSSQLKAYRQETQDKTKDLKEFIAVSPLKRMQGLIKSELEKSDKYRISILSRHKSFAGLPEESILFAARSMEETRFKKGDYIIRQDEIGDKFYILEEGRLRVVVSI